MQKDKFNTVAHVNNSTFVGGERAAELPIVVHSHLRWDFVWQRPQQILARLAPARRIAFIEEPTWDAADTSLAITEPLPNIVRIVPKLCSSVQRDMNAQCTEILGHLRAAFVEHPLLAGRFERVIQWFYSPMVAPVFLGKFNAAAVVYDCMDELAKFRGAPADLPEREAVLLAAADVVFTGGYQLFRRKSRLHRNVHFYGCGVDVNHYGKARDDATTVPGDVASLPHPMVGYFGVVDERLDYELIDALATAFADGSVVMIGPFAKVDPCKLPRRSNLHWLGQRPYDTLPAYVKSFDVCLMPFALNEATENINPTKTLEYMAAGKPIVSTAVADVVRNFTPIVQVAHTQEEFIALARRASASPDAASIALGLERARAATWDATVRAMLAHVQAAVRAKQGAQRQLVSA
ncbi:MAG TPA: glycosyltransferase [Casimicrobiaceae bacterium]|nr:glycosyltransferase [Casimicrobiaceae bacterium]